MPNVLEANICISLTDPMKVLSVSDGIEDMLGFKSDDFLTGKVSLKSLIHADDLDIADDLFSTEINQTSGTFNIRLRQANGRIRCIKAHYTKALDASGNNVVLELLLQDAKSLRQRLSDQPLMDNFKAMMENTDDYIYFKDRNHVFTGASQTLVEITESTKHWTELIGLTGYDVFAEEYADIYYLLEKQVFAGIAVAHDIQETLDRNGNKGWVDNRKYPIHNENSEIVGLFGIARIITERKQAEAKIKRVTQLYSALSHCNEAIVRCANEAELFPRICRDMVQFGGMKMAWIGLLDEVSKWVKPVASFGDDDEYLTDIQISMDAADPLSQGPVGTAIRENQPVWCPDFINDPRTTAWRERGARAGWAAMASLPLHSNGVIVGTFNVYATEVNAFDEDIRNLLIEMAINISFALDGFARETARKQVEEALLESEDRLTFAFKGSGDGMWDWNVATGAVNYSKQWKEMLGFAGDEIKNDFKEWERRIHPDDLQPTRGAIQAYLDGTTPRYAHEHRMLCKDGSYKWVLTRGIARSCSADGKPVRMIGTHTDITVRKQTKEALRIAAAAFEAQEGIMVTDSQRIIIRVNKAFTQLTGYSAEDAVGQPVSILKSGQHDAAFYQAQWEVIVRDGYWQGEIWDQRKNGDVFPAWMTITAVSAADGRTTHYVGSFLDITLQKQVEKVLLDDRIRLNRQVEKSMVELSQLKEESGELNTALKVMIKLQETQSSEAKNLLILELKQEVMPFLQRLKGSSRDPKHIRLLSTLDANLQRLISSYGSATSLTSVYKNLTPKEIQVASMVREGASTKAIAATLSLSPETISIHRKNIRKKLGLDSKADNLRSNLITLAN